MEIIQTGTAMLLFAAIFMAGGRVHRFVARYSDPRSMVSFGAGMAAAYVFVRVMPELQGARHAFATSVSARLPFEGMVIYFVALVGYLAFYSLEHLRARARDTAEAEQATASFRLHVGGFTAYVFLMGYMLVHQLEKESMSIALYAVAIGFHFLSIDRELRQEHGAAYDQVGRFILAGASVFGWAVGLIIALPHHALSLLVAFLSGAIIINSAVMELPSAKNGRFLPFIFGGLAYGLLLLPLG